MTKIAALAKMNARYGWTHTDYFMMLVDLKRTAARLERKALRAPDMYGDQAEWAQLDYNEALSAE